MADQLAASQAFLAEFWAGQDLSPQAIASHQKESGRTWLEEVQAYLDGFAACDLSDEELRRCTEGSDLLFHLAVVFREAGLLSPPLPAVADPVERLRAAVDDPSDPRSLRELGDELLASWIDRAPRFGAVAAHFPESLRKRRFVASFWAPEVFFWAPEVLAGPWPTSSYTGEKFGWYVSGGTRPGLDFCMSHAIDRASWVPVRIGGAAKHMPAFAALAQPEFRPFWSPELPEVRLLEPIPGDQLLSRLPIQGEIHYRGPRGWHYIAAFLLLLCLSLPAGAQTLMGVVSKVTDGDTLMVGQARIRLFGIDAPESSQTCHSAQGQAYRCGDTAEVFLARLAPAGSSTFQLPEDWRRCR